MTATLRSGIRLRITDTAGSELIHWVGNDNGAPAGAEHSFPHAESVRVEIHDPGRLDDAADGLHPLTWLGLSGDEWRDLHSNGRLGQFFELTRAAAEVIVSGVGDVRRMPFAGLLSAEFRGRRRGGQIGACRPA